MPVKWIMILCVLCLTFIQTSTASAHRPNESYLFLRIDEQAIEGRVEITLPDLNRALGLNLPTEGVLPRDLLTPHIGIIQAYILDHLKFSTGQTPLALRYTSYEIFNAGFTQFAQIGFIIEDLAELPRSVDIDYTLLFDTDPTLTGFLVIEQNWFTGTLNNEINVSLIFTSDQPRQTLDLTDSTRMNGFLSFIRLGNWHIGIGIDHILFIVALLLPAVMVRRGEQWISVTHFRPALIQVIKVITLFTLAHSITLSLAALDIVRLPTRLVESAIALSIGAAALDIIFPIFGKRIWVVIFGFGLFHGFGFAEVLADLGLKGMNLGIALFGFNLGVELGQILIICLVFPVLYVLRQFDIYPTYILKGGSAVLILAALYWSVKRIFEVDLAVSNQVRHLIQIILPS